MHVPVYAIVQATWGLPQTLLGAATFLAHAKRPHFLYHGAVVTTWESRKALSLGPFIFLEGPDDPTIAAFGVDQKLLAHEYGHTVQSLVLGPLYLPVVGLPSALWLNVPAFSRLRQRKRIPYYNLYTERSANYLAAKALKNR